MDLKLFRTKENLLKKGGGIELVEERKELEVVEGERSVRLKMLTKREEEDADESDKIANSAL